MRPAGRQGNLNLAAVTQRRPHIGAAEGDPPSETPACQIAAISDNLAGRICLQRNLAVCGIEIMEASALVFLARPKSLPRLARAIFFGGFTIFVRFYPPTAPAVDAIDQSAKAAERYSLGTINSPSSLSKSLNKQWARTCDQGNNSSPPEMRKWYPSGPQ